MVQLKKIFRMQLEVLDLNNVAFKALRRISISGLKVKLFSPSFKPVSASCKWRGVVGKKLAKRVLDLVQFDRQTDRRTDTRV